MEERRLIFLDVDGVLNHQNWYSQVHKQFSLKEINTWPMAKYHMSPETTQLLNQLNGAEVVISSSWGYDDETVNGLRDAGLTLPIIGGIEHIEYAHSFIGRGNAIAKWFDDNYNYVPWDYKFENGWANTHVTYDGTMGDFIKGTEEKVYHEDNIKLAYVIFDDDSDMMLWQKEHFIHINGQTGITQKDIDKAKQLLNIQRI